MRNFVILSQLTADELNEILLPSPIVLWQLHFATYPGVTGWLMWVILIAVFGTVQLRRRNFKIFWGVHHLYILFFIALILHGQNSLVFSPLMWMILLPTGLIFTIERLRRFISSGYDTLLVTVNIFFLFFKNNY